MMPNTCMAFIFKIKCTLTSLLTCYRCLLRFHDIFVFTTPVLHALPQPSRPLLATENKRPSALDDAAGRLHERCAGKESC